MHAEQIVKRPILLTEKTSRLRETSNQYTFEVAEAANKIQIKSAIEHLFGVKVASVNTLIHGKLHHWKKAIVTLEAGASIAFFAEKTEATE